jgi:hypothetical protein
MRSNPFLPSRRRASSSSVAVLGALAISFALLLALAPGCGEAEPAPSSPGTHSAPVAEMPAQARGGAPHDGDCAPGEWRYDDLENDDLSENRPPGYQVGDLLCYARCDQDADCADGLTCQVVGLWANVDVGCADSIRVCRATPPPTSCDASIVGSGPTAQQGQPCQRSTDCFAPYVCNATTATCQ